MNTLPGLADPRSTLLFIDDIDFGHQGWNFELEFLHFDVWELTKYHVQKRAEEDTARVRQEIKDLTQRLTAEWDEVSARFKAAWEGLKIANDDKSGAMNGFFAKNGGEFRKVLRFIREVEEFYDTDTQQTEVIHTFTLLGPKGQRLVIDSVIDVEPY